MMSSSHSISSLGSMPMIRLCTSERLVRSSTQPAKKMLARSPRAGTKTVSFDTDSSLLCALAKMMCYSMSNTVTTAFLSPINSQDWMDICWDSLPSAPDFKAKLKEVRVTLNLHANSRLFVICGISPSRLGSLTFPTDADPMPVKKYLKKSKAHSYLYLGMASLTCHRLPIIQANHA